MAGTGKPMITLLDTYIDTQIEQLAHLASSVINEHVNQGGVCAVCGCAFPCDRAVLAEHNLAVCGCLP